jgi:hypothetical protein
MPPQQASDIALAEASIEFCILAKNLLGDGLEVTVRYLKQVRYRSLCELLGLYAQMRSVFAELRDLSLRELDGQPHDA